MMVPLAGTWRTPMLAVWTISFVAPPSLYKNT